MLRRQIIINYSIIGILGPLLGGMLILLELESEATIIIATSIWPTWGISWFVMGEESKLIANLIIGLAVVSNVIVFACLGWIYSMLNFSNKLSRYLFITVVYVLSYSSLWFVVTEI